MADISKLIEQKTKDASKRHSTTAAPKSTSVKTKKYDAAEILYNAQKMRNKKYLSADFSTAADARKQLRQDLGMETEEYKWASENEKRQKQGVGFQVNNGQIYSFEPLTTESLQKSIEWADSEIEKLKEQGGTSNILGEIIFNIGNMGNGGKASNRGKEIGDASQKIRELESQRAVYQQYLNALQQEEDIERIKNDVYAENKLGAIFNIDNEQKLYFLNSGEEGYDKDSYYDRSVKREQLVAELKDMGYDDTDRLIESYSQYRNDETIEPILKLIKQGIVEHPVLGTAATTAINAVTAPMQGVGQAFDSITGALGIHGYSAASLPGTVSDLSKTTVNKVIDENIDNQYLNSFAKIAYGAATSIVENGYINKTFDKLSEGILGLNAAMSTYNTAKERGLSDGQALANGIAAGIFETLFEHFSLEKLRVFQASPATTLKPFIKNVLKQSLAEGSEELFTDIANAAYDYFVNGGLSQFEQALQNGMTAGEYTTQFISQLRETFFTGALSGAGMIGVAAAPTAVRGSMINALEDAKQGYDISRINKLTDDVLADAKASGYVLRKKAENAEKRIADGKGITYRKLGEINRKVIKKQRENDIDKILSTKEYKELSVKERNAIRSSVLTHLNDPKIVSPEQQEVLQTDNAKKILEEMQSLEYSHMEERDNKRIAKINSEIEEAEKQSKNQKKIYGEIRTAVSEGNTERLVKNTFEAVNKEGHTVEVGAVRSITDGEFEVVQDASTGATAKLSELNIKDEQIKVLYSELQKASQDDIPLSVEAVNVALSMYNAHDNTSAKAYALWAHDAYKAASYKINDAVMTFSEFEELYRSAAKDGEVSYKGDITREQLKNMYETGAKNLEVKYAVTRIGHKGLTKHQAEQVFIIDRLAKKYNSKVVLVDNRLTDEDGNGVNALYKSGSDTIVLSLINDNNLLLVHFGHEIFHQAKMRSRKEAQFLQDTVIRILQSDSRYDFDGIFKQISNAYEGLTDDELLEEIAAQYLAVAFSNEKNIKKIVNEATATEKGYIQRMFDNLKKFINDVKQLITLYGDRDMTVRAAVSTPTEQLEYMAEQLEILLAEAAKKEKPTTETGGVKKSLSVIGLDAYNKDSINKIKMRNGVIVNSISELKNYVSEALSGDVKQNLHLGAIPKTVIAQIENDINEKIFTDKQYTFVVSYDDIRHVSEHFADVDELTNEILRLYDILSNYDSVECLIEENGRKKLRLEKAYAHAEYRSIEIVSNKNSSVDLISFYVTKKHNKKGSQSVPPATQGSLSGGARLPNNTVSQNTQSVNNNDMQNGKKNATKYSVKIDTDGKKFVDVDPDLFDVRDGESHAKTIARIIKDRFNNLISVNGQQIQINKTTNDEWRRSNGADALRNRDSQGYFDKLKTIPHADEILKAAKNWIGEDKHHPRKDDIVEFARGNVYYRVGNNGYAADVIVAIRKNGAAVLYDLDDIRAKKITDVSLAMASESPQRSAETSVTDNVSHSNKDVKKKYSRQMDNTDDKIEQMKLENESFFQYLDRLGNSIGQKIKEKRTPGSSLVYDREAFYDIARKYNLLDSEAGGWFKSSKYSDTEIVNVMENIMVGISDELITPEAGLSRLARIQEEILKTGYELKYGKDLNGVEIKAEAAKSFKQDIRNKPIYVSQYTFSKLMDQYGTKRKLRAASFHQLSIKEEDSDNTPNVDFLYGEMQKKYPNLLTDVTEQLDMINELISTERAVQPQVEYISEKEGFKGFLDLSEAAVRRAADMLTEAFNVELKQGDLQSQYEELRGVRQTLDRTKKYYRDLLNDSAKIRAEREQKAILAKRILRVSRRLDKLLRKETDTKHIPEGLKEPVAKFLQIIKGSITNSFGESLIDTSLSLAELNKAYESYGYEDTMHPDESYAKKLSQLQFVLHGNKRLKDLSLGELETVEEIVTHINYLVNEGNKTFVDMQKRGYEHVASVSTEEVFAHKEERKKGLEKIKDAEYHMLTPYVFFKMIGTRFEGSHEVTEVLGELGNALFKGEEKTARNVEQVKKKTQEIMKTWGYDSRWLSDKKDFIFESGQKVSMTTENIMNVLATYDREEASGFKTDHILAGGIAVNESSHKTVSDYIKPLPETIKTRYLFNKARKERKERLKNNKGKILIGMTDAERAKVLKETALEVVDATDVELSEDVNNQFEELKKKNKSQYFNIIRDFGKELDIFKDYTNENVSIDFNYSIGSARESVDKVFERSSDRVDFVKMFSVFDDVVRNAQLVEIHKDKYMGTKKENTNLKQVYVLLSAFQDGSSIIPVEFEIKEFKVGVKNQLYVSVNLKRIEAEVMKAVEPKSPDAFRPTSNFRLTDIISNVNPLDSEFLKYIPASMLNEQQVEGRNEGIRKEKLRIAEIERTGDVNVSVEVTEDEQKALAAKIAESMRVYISKKDIDMLRAQLTPIQVGYYKALVREMSEHGADMGNEVSMLLHGTKKYNEENYCPVTAVSDYLLERFGNKKVGQRRLKNRSFTKRITENANTPILIDNMSEVYAKHMYEMCTYNGMTIPLESLERLLNYKLPDEYERVGDKIQKKKGKSYRELFREAFGDRGLQYLENLLEDLNGGIKVDDRGALNSMITSFKRSAVSASLTVAFQQPGAVGRAMFRINPQYFTPTAYMPLLDNVTGKYTDFFDRYDELLKYCPLAVIKDIGKFDTNVGQSYEEWILDVKPKFRRSIKEVDRIAPWLYHKTEDLFMWLPGYLDKATWLHIWNAVKRETAHKNGVKVNRLTEKQLAEAGERMTQVIRETQVYDSVLSRSDLMRSKNPLAQMATAFMAEPTVTYNMMRYAAVTAKHQPKVLVRAIASVLCSIILTDFLKNLAEAIRYDDEETDFGEMLLSGTVVDIISDLNPLTYIPYVKDIWSLCEGYDIERVDMSVFSKVIDALKPFIDSEKEAGYEEWEQLIVTLSMFTGIPINNLWKDITGIKAKFKKGSPKFSIEAVGNSIKSELSENPFIKLAGKIFPPIYYFFDMSDEKIIYNAILNDDESVLDRYRLPTDEDIDDIINKGYSETDAILKATDNAENSFHSKVVKGLISEDSRIQEAADARLNSDTETYESLIEELTELGFDKNDVIKAVDKYIDSLEEKTYEHSETKDKSLYSYDDLFVAINSNNMTSAKHIFEILSEEKSMETVQSDLRKEYADDIYNAILDGDDDTKKHLVEMFDEFEYDYHYAVILGLRENDDRVLKAAEARYSGDTTAYEKLKTDIVADGFDENDVFNAIETETEKLAPDEDDEESHPEDSYLYEAADLKRYAEAYNLSATKTAIQNFKDSGKEDGDIRKELTTLFKKKYITAWKSGNSTEVDTIREFLLALNVGYTYKSFTTWEKEANSQE